MSDIRTREEIYENRPDKLSGTDSVTVTVDENTILRKADKEILGVGIGNGADQSVWLDDGTENISERTEKMMESIYTIPSVRFQFIGRAFYNIGPLSERKGSSFITVSDGREHERTTSKTPYGPVELIKMFQMNNPDIEFVFCVDIDDDPENLADFAHFLFDGKTESKWGAMRAMYGISEPLKHEKVIFEMGNERDAAANWSFSEAQLEWYIKRAGAAVDAILKEFPDSKICLCGKTAPWGDAENHRKWTKGLASAMKGKFQYWSQHLYYAGNEISIIEQYLNWVTEDLDSALGENHGVQILMTEHAKWPKLGVGSADDLLTLESVLATGMFLTRMYRRTDMHAAHYHTFYSMNYRCWPMVVVLDDTVIPCGMEKMMKLFSENIGDRVVSAEYTGNSDRVDITKPACKFSVLATPSGKREMTIFLVNRSADYDIDIKFDFKNSDYTLKSETVFTAPNINSMIISSDTQDVFSEQVNEKNEKNFSEYRLANKSFVVLKLESGKDLLTASNSGESEIDEPAPETGFKDIASHWAKNEIARMTELGFVKGKSESEFAPDDLITRGEAAAVVSRMLSTDLVNAQNYPRADFSDVPENNPFFSYINMVYYCGIMRGDKGEFRPNDNITVEEMVCIANRIYERAKGASDVNDDEHMLDCFVYSDRINPWARRDVAKACSRGLLYRMYENGRLDVSDYATRAVGVYMLERVRRELLK